mgnify:CR=1 FL=1
MADDAVEVHDLLAWTPDAELGLWDLVGAIDLTSRATFVNAALREPLELAGGFAIDGLAGAFIERIEGSPSCVIGLSLPALRRLVIKLGHEYPSLWNR